MMNDLKRTYCDSCVFVHIIEGTVEYRNILQEMMIKAEQQAVELYTSQVSIAEVIYAKEEKDKRRLSEDVLAKIMALWAPSSPLRQIEFFDGIAHQSRDRARWAIGEGRSLKPLDSIHLATALYIKADTLFTFDDKLLNLDQRFGLKICKPFLVQDLLSNI